MPAFCSDGSIRGWARISPAFSKPYGVTQELIPWLKRMITNIAPSLKRSRNEEKRGHEALYQG